MSTLSFDEAEALAQRARALLQAARAAAGRDPTGRRQLVAEAMQLVDRALGARDVGVQTLRAAIGRFESWYLRRSLERNANRRIVTARELGITRECLYKKMKRYGID